LRLLTLAFAATLASHAAPLLVVSVDGLDWRYLRDADHLALKIPNIRRLMAEGEVTQGIIGVYPTVTWPSHTSIITGARPDQHGILGNRRPAGGDYYWTVDLLKATTLWQKAHDRGLKTAAITWPVTVNGAIDFNLPEYFLKRNGGSMDLAGIESKATPGLVEKIRAAFPSFAREWVDDRARTQALLYLLKNEHPDLILVHLVDLDSDAHDSGPFTRGANATLEYTDELIGQVLAALPQPYVFALVSDHGFERVDRAVDLKALNPPGELQVMGLLAVTKNTAVVDWLRAQNGVGRQVPQEDLQQYAPALAGSFVFEPAEHVVFGTNIPEIGTHGYFPTRSDYRSVFILRGPGIAHRQAPEVSMLTIAPRLEQILFSNR
jgi:predicted AlkP superfamily pyrophosphatase or phosphodiesterase